MTSFTIKPFLFLVLACLSIGQLHAQSKKEINAQLKIELEQKVKDYDWLQSSKDLVSSSLSQARKAAASKYAEYTGLKDQEKTSLKALLRNKELLTNIGGNSEAIFSSKELTSLQPPLINEKFKFIPNEKENPPLKLKYVAPIEDYTNLKVKSQNELLSIKIKEYDSINKLNTLAIQEVKEQTTAFSEIKNEYENTSKLCVEYNKMLDTKIDALASEWRVQKKIQLQKRQAEYDKKYKELEAKQKKQKPGVIAFIPPIIMNDDEVHEEEETPVTSKELRIQRYEAKQEYYSNYNNDIEPPMPKPEPPREPIILDLVEVSPEYPGGMIALNSYLKENIVVPEKVKTGEVSGRVYLRFVISETGNISNVKVQRGVADCPECDAEAVRVVKAMPNWKPGQNNGKPVNMWYNLPVKFKSE